MIIMVKGNWLEKLKTFENINDTFLEFVVFVENNIEWREELTKRLFQLFRRYHYTGRQIDLINSLAWMNLAEFPSNLPNDIKTKLENLRLEKERKREKQKEQLILECMVPEVDTDENILELMTFHLSSDPKNLEEGDFVMRVGLYHPLVYPNPTLPDPSVPIESIEYLLDVQKYTESNPHNEKTRMFEFDRVICTNKLVTKLLYLESYVKDIYRLMFLAKPSILNDIPETNIKSAISNSNSWQELLENIFNDYIIDRRFTLMNLLEHLKNSHSVHLALNDEEYTQLNFCVLVRNVYVHKGGIIDKEFLKKYEPPKKENTKHSKNYPEYIEGKLCPISFGLINLLDELSYILTSYLCLRVLTDYLNYPLEKNWLKT